MNSYSFSDYDIQAFVDDELSHEDAKKVQAYIERQPYAQKRYKQFMDQKKLLKLWWKNLQQ